MLGETDSIENLECRVETARRAYNVWKALVCGLAGAFLLVSVGGYLGSQFLRARSSPQYPACYANLKNFGTAMEMYSTDWSGKYPTSLEYLTPNYLKTLLECPAAGRMSYKAQFGPNVQWNTPGFRDYYLIWCDGCQHPQTGAPQGFPFYDGIGGLVRNPDELLKGVR